jgi:hypothetical protein
LNIRVGEAQKSCESDKNVLEILLPGITFLVEILELEGLPGAAPSSSWSAIGRHLGRQLCEQLEVVGGSDGGGGGRPPHLLGGRGGGEKAGRVGELTQGASQGLAAAVVVVLQGIGGGGASTPVRLVLKIRKTRIT